MIENMSKPRGSQSRYKNKYNQCASRRKLSEIKLKRTDTTLDLSFEVVSKCIASGGDCWGGVPNRQRELKKKRKDGSQKSSIYTARKWLVRASEQAVANMFAWFVLFAVTANVPARKLDFSAGGYVTCTTFVSQLILSHSTGVSTKPDLVTRSKPLSSNIISRLNPL